MEFKDNVPIYLQIEQYLYHQIATGILKPGAQIPSVRQLAVELTVNINTVQRALREMNAQGILNTKRGEGNFVTKDEELINTTKQDLIDHVLLDFITSMKTYGVSEDLIPQMVRNFIKKEGK